MNWLMKSAMVVGLFALLLSTTSLEAGIFRRCRSRSCENRSACQCEATRGPCGEGTTCPVFKWADHGSYCSFYALSCHGLDPATACNYDGACGTGFGSDCTTCGNTTTCIQARNLLSGENAHHKVSSDLGQRGMRGPMVVADELEVVDRRAVRPKTPHTNYNGMTIQLRIHPNTLVLVQLWGMTVTPSILSQPGDPVDCFIGHQIAGNLEGDIVDGTRIVGTNHAYTCDYKGNTYTVVTHKSSP